MNQEQLRIMSGKKGFIAALDQSGGSTPKALKNYGIREDQYSNDEEMFNLVHEMRTRIITSPSFTSDHILAAILFENSMERKIGDKLTADYLWEEKGIIPILKVDKGLAEEADGVRLMKPVPGLDELLVRAVERHIFGTKMRSVIKQANHVVRVVALSGGYSRQEANERLSRSPGLIASFSRALSEGLNANQTQGEFDRMLAQSIKEIYDASIT